MRSETDNPLLEVVLHSGEPYVLEGFREYLRGLDIRLDLDRRIQVQGLCFLSVNAPWKLHEQMAKFSFLRVAREMPSLRELRPGTVDGHYTLGRLWIQIRVAYPMSSMSQDLDEPREGSAILQLVQCFRGWSGLISDFGCKILLFINDGHYHKSSVITGVQWKGPAWQL